MTIPLTPTVSSTSQSTVESGQVNVNKDLPTTPRKLPAAKSHTPSPGKGKKCPAIEVRIPTPTSPTEAAGKRSVRKETEGNTEEEQGTDREKGSLNPRSSSFEPKLHPKSFLSRLQNLSIGTDEDPSILPTKNDVSFFDTPRRSGFSVHDDSTPKLSYTPHTPSTGHSAGVPVTPVTPLHAPFSNNELLPYGKEGKQPQASIGHNETQSAEDVGRYLMIQDIPPDTSESSIVDLIQSICEFKALMVKHNKIRGYVLVAFYDSREALKLYETLRTSSVSFVRGSTAIKLHCLKVDQSLLLSSCGRDADSEKIITDSNPVIKIKIAGGVGISHSNMQDTMRLFGPLKRLDPVGHEGRLFLAEFYDTRDATKAIEALDGQMADKALISVSHIQPNTTVPQTTASNSRYTLGSAAYVPGKLGQRSSAAFSQVSSPTSSDVFGYDTSTDSASTPLQTPRMSAFGRVRSDGDVFSPRKPSSIYSSASQSRHASGYSTPLSWDRASGYETPNHMLALGRRLHEPGTVQGLINNADIEARARQGQGLGGHFNANDRKAIPAQNRVFPERILSGLDPRTTVMVKDVPNKLSREELVKILEEVVPGDYDFVYLRFDFKNCCNVGYAFVNFCSVAALYQFIQAKVGKKWNMFSSEKVLQVSYADIQGKAALINKFKNSAVMGVIESWRPQIFYSSGRMKGQPEPFPESDNLAVRQRSAAAQLAGFSNPSSYSYGYDDQHYYDYSSPHGSAYGT